MLLDSDVDPEKLQGIGSELKNLIKSIEWDLEDLDQTISILQDLALTHRCCVLPSPSLPLLPSFFLSLMGCFACCGCVQLDKDPHCVTCCDSKHITCPISSVCALV